MTGWSSLKNGIKEGLPKSFVVQENVDVVRKLIKEDSYVTYHELELWLSISMTSIYKILHENLCLRKLRARWILLLLTDVQKKLVSTGAVNDFKMQLWCIQSSIQRRHRSRGFMRLSQKRWAIRQFGCFKVKQTQQKMFVL